MKKIYVPEIGFAQVGKKDFEQKQIFEKAFQIKELLKLKLNKSFSIARETTRYEYYKGDVSNITRLIHIILVCNDSVTVKLYTDTINKVESIDWEEFEPIVRQEYLQAKIAEKNKVILQESQELTLEQVSQNYGVNDLYELLTDYRNSSVVPTTCPLQCEVEPDGKCQHGYESILIKAGIM